MDGISSISLQPIQNLDGLFRILAAKETDDLHRINVWYKLLEILRVAGNQAVCIDQSVCDNLLSRLLVSVSMVDAVEEGIDLFGVAFTYCSVNESLQTLVFQFISQLEENSNLNLLFLKTCSLRPHKDHVPGFYDIIFQLQTFKTLDAKVMRFLDLNLGDVILNSWIPSWKSWIDSFRNNCKDFDVVHFLVQERILIKTVQRHELDMAIANFQVYPRRLKALLNIKTEATQYLSLKFIRRSLKFFKWLNKDLQGTVISFSSNSMNNHTFEQLFHDNGEFYLQVIMEIVDHPELELLEESHLLLLLRVSLGHVWEKCIMSNQISEVHHTLGKMGTTQSLPSLINLLQYILSKYCINVMECINNGYEMETNSLWYRQLTNLAIPAWFEDLSPKIPPVSRAVFGFDDNRIEKGQMINSFQENFSNIFECMQLTLSLNGALLTYYGNIGLNPLCLGSQAMSNCISDVQNKTVSMHFTIYFVPLFTVLLLSQKLLETDGASRTFLNAEAALVDAKQLFRQSIKQIECIIDNHGNNGLYHLIKFVSQVSIESLLFQDISMIILRHIFFESDGQWILQLCLANELTTHGLLDYIVLWNDGSELYSPFFTEIFKQPQPEILRKTVVLGDLFELLMEKTKQPSKEGISHPKVRSKFNTNASSFVPQDTSMHTRTPKKIEQSPQYPVHPSLSSYGFKPVSVGTTSGVSAGMNTSFADCFSGVFNSDQQSKAQMVQNWSSPPPVSQYNQVNSTKLVNTGKSYILGGHNRAVNNSRTKSVHVDDFEQR